MHPHHHLPRRTLQDALRRRVRDRRLGRLVQHPAPPQLTGHDPPGRVRGAPLRGPQPRARPRKVAAENPGRFKEPGPDEDTGTAPSWSRTDTDPTPLSTPHHGGSFPPMTRKITRHPHTKNRTRQTTDPTSDGDNPPPGRTLWRPLTEATDELSLGHGQPAGGSGDLRWDGVLQHGHR